MKDRTFITMKFIANIFDSLQKKPIIEEFERSVGMEKTDSVQGNKVSK